MWMFINTGVYIVKFYSFIITSRDEMARDGKDGLGPDPLLQF